MCVYIMAEVVGGNGMLYEPVHSSVENLWHLAGEVRGFYLPPRMVRKAE